MPLINGSKKPDSLDGGAGDDTIFGLAGNDTINGLGGSDLIDGGDGADTISAGEGNDTIAAGRGDLINGDGGDDVVTITGDEPSGVSTTLAGDAGVDTLTLDFSGAIDALTSTSFGGGSGSMSDIGYAGFERLIILGGAASDNLSGSDGEDTLNGGGGNDRLDGKAGINTFIGGTGRDIAFIDVSASDVALTVDFAGIDTTVAGNTLVGVEGLGLKAGLAADLLSVDDARASSEIYGGGGNDTLSGVNAWADTLDGGAGADTITFARGDVVRGGDADDVFMVTSDELSGGFTSISGDAGSDRIVFDFSTAFDVVTSSNSSGFGGVAGISYSGVERVEIYGGTASDSLVGGAGADTLSGGRGNDRLDGQTGANQLIGGDGRDIAMLDLADTTAALTLVFKVSGKAVKIGLNKLSGIESLGLKAGSGDDNINVAGAQSKSELFGNGGADTLVGSAAWNDTLDGGAGNDLIVFGVGDNVRGGDGEDELRIDYTPVSGASAQITGDAGVDTLRADFSAATYNISSANTNNGSGSVNSISFSGVELLTLITGSGADTLAGGEGSDTLVGGAGNDVITGASDLDYITGGAGADQLTGGLSGDRFVYLAVGDSTVALAGRDTIADWSSQDRIDLSAIDADPGVDGDQAFAFIGAAAFSNHAGQVRVEVVDGLAIVTGDVNGDGTADFAIALAGGGSVTEGSFIL
jgi:Ca2+-binding RTX toxin-like protein